MKNNLKKVYKKQILEGVAVPAFIRNGANYFVDLCVYENGRVADWNFEDFSHFVQDVQKGWVRVSVPDGEGISVHGLGSFYITDGTWLYNKESFVDYIAAVIKELNPHEDNIFTYREKIIGKVRYGESGTGTVYKEQEHYKNDPFPKKIDGDSINLFYRGADQYFLVNLIVYPDNTFEISRIEHPTHLTHEQLLQMVADGILLTAIPDNTPVTIYGLGSFTVSGTNYVETIENKLLEVKDILSKLQGLPTTVKICIAALETYNKNPTEENKKHLKESYENIPEHHRMYVGDMDTRDSEVTSIIYRN